MVQPIISTAPLMHRGLKMERISCLDTTAHRAATHCMMTSAEVLVYLREARTQKGRCLIQSGNGFLILPGSYKVNQKAYGTPEQLVSLLEERGMEIDIDPFPIIRREGYYRVINGYKGPFLDRKRMQTSPDDIYAKGTTLSDVYDLFLFDRQLRDTVFPYLTSAESVVRSTSVDAFCNAHQEITAYQDRQCYTDSQWMLFPKSFKGNKEREYQKRIGGLLKVFKDKLEIKSQTPDYVVHYLDRYGNVPLWVLQYNLTFGNVKNFFQLQRRNEQVRTCKTIQELTGSTERLEPQGLLKAITVLVNYRNICAHNERLYCASPQGSSFSDMIRALHQVLPHEEVAAMVANINGVTANHPKCQSPNLAANLINGMKVKVKHRQSN